MHIKTPKRALTTDTRCCNRMTDVQLPLDINAVIGQQPGEEHWKIMTIRSTRLQQGLQRHIAVSLTCSGVVDCPLMYRDGGCQFLETNQWQTLRRRRCYCPFVACPIFERSRPWPLVPDHNSDKSLRMFTCWLAEGRQSFLTMGSVSSGYPKLSLSQRRPSVPSVDTAWQGSSYALNWWIQR